VTGQKTKTAEDLKVHHRIDTDLCDKRKGQKPKKEAMQ
jgi:hypothetical protein